jgi:hypothetical protein
MNVHLMATCGAGCDLNHFFLYHQRVDNSRALALGDMNLRSAYGTYFSVRLEWGSAMGTVAGNQGIATGTLVGTGCQFKVTEGTVEKEWCFTVGTDFIIFADLLTAGGTNHRATLIAEAIFQKERCAAIGTLSVEFRWQDKIDLL